ncbi:hypothetical protein J7S33_26645 [Saccharothrix algeriensis]|uniref:Secreted protein n=1 Tax=Saccharothrix algeriensis TaxID=173560 RepID=A0A8T8HVM4_9PSEU|nr:hypothetical protein J7S33_26645 [Saccharothrix algeriensis]
MFTLVPLSVRLAGPVLLGVALLTACSQGSGGSPATTTPVAADGPVRFTQCVRERGFTLPDPSPGAQTVELPAEAKTDPAMAAAVDGCRHFLGQGSGKDAEDPRAQDRALALARCLRERGMAVQDPAPGQPLRLDLDSKDPKAVQAVQDCRRDSRRTTGGQSGGE